jgi:hypothetical protein
MDCGPHADYVIRRLYVEASNKSGGCGPIFTCEQLLFIVLETRSFLGQCEPGTAIVSASITTLRIDMHTFSCHGICARRSCAACADEANGRNRDNEVRFGRNGCDSRLIPLPLLCAMPIILDQPTLPICGHLFHAYITRQWTTTADG